MKTIVLPCCLLLAACAVRQPNIRFRVLRGSPNDLLRTPDAQKIPFPDVLHAYNGFEAVQSYIDLRPLMELRIENAYYQPGASRRGLAGFLGTEIAHYAVAAQGLQLLSVQSMKSRPTDDKPVGELIAKSETSFKYYRLYYEIVFAKVDHSQGSVLLGADSENEMDRLAAELINPESVCHPGARHCTVFPEACSVSAEMEIVVNGNAQTVVWGTVLGRIITHPRHLNIKRLYAGGPVPIQLNPRDPGILLLPILPGDQINWR